MSFAVHQVRASGQGGARDDFEKMVAELASATMPGVRMIAANPGDWGIDALVGDLDGGSVTVWQAKYFYPATIGNHQQQIRDSLRAAIASAAQQGYQVERWVLCIPSSMDPPTARWWDGWKKEQESAHSLVIDLWDDAELTHRLRLPEAERVRRAYYEAAPAGLQGSVVAVQTGDHNIAVGSIGSLHLHAAPQSTATSPHQGRDAAPPGWPVGECDPFDLEVHRHIALSSPRPRELPAYVKRPHDERLRAIVEEAAAGASRMVVLVGESSTGKSRALWEVVRHLPPTWRLWHPVSAEELLNGLGAVVPRTVVWLNNAEKYLSRASGLGEGVASGLRSLLRACKPVLILGTAWPRLQAELASGPSVADDDAPSHVQDLLTIDAVRIRVPDAFTGAALDAVRTAAGTDRLLRFATAHAQDGKITQYLAGVPLLLERCRLADPPTEAVIKAAMDLCRLGHDRENLPRVLLKEAASGYLTTQQWDSLPHQWFEKALAYAGAECRGVPGPLTRRRPRPGRPDEACYGLADVLAQRAQRAQDRPCPPEAFWEAAVLHARTPADRAALAFEAEQRGRYRYAARLYELAAAAGHPEAWLNLVMLLEILGHAQKATVVAQRSGRPDVIQEIEEFRALVETGTEWALGCSSDVVDDRPSPLERKIRKLQESGHYDAAVQCALDAAHEGDTDGFEEALRLWEEGGEYEKAAKFAIHTTNVSFLLGNLVAMREQAGDRAGAQDLARRAADAGHPDAVSELAGLRMRAGNPEEAQRIAKFGLNADGSPAEPW